MRLFRLSSLAYILIAAIVAVNIYILFSQSVRLDESQSLWVSIKPVGSILKFTSLDVHVPLYLVLLHFWLQIFGTDIAAARALSLIFFILSIPVLYLFVKESANSKTALLATLLYICSPFIIWYSNETRMYSLLVFISCVSHLFFLRVFRSQTREGKVGYFFSLLFGFYTHYFFTLIVLTQSIFIFYRWVLRREYFLASKVYTIIALATSLFLPWLYYFIQQGGASGTQPLIPPPSSYNIFQSLILFLFGFQNTIIQNVLISLWPILVVFLFYIFTRRQSWHLKESDYLVLCTILPVLLVFLASFYKPIFLPRYLIFVIPTMFCLISFILASYKGWVFRSLFGVFLLIMCGFLIYQNISPDTNVKEDYKDVTIYLNQQVTPQDIVLITAPFTIYPVEYYYKAPAKLETIPVWDRFSYGNIPPFDENKLQSQINNYQKIYSKAYVVLSYDQGYEKKIDEYLDTHLERLEVKDFSPGLQLRVYKLRYNQ